MPRPTLTQSGYLKDSSNELADAPHGVAGAQLKLNIKPEILLVSLAGAPKAAEAPKAEAPAAAAPPPPSAAAAPPPPPPASTVGPIPTSMPPVPPVPAHAMDSKPG